MKKFYILVLAGMLSQPVISQSGCTFLCNADFENTSPLITTAGLLDSTMIPCWHTNATDGKMEVWGTGNNGVPSYSGNQFVELNATQPATMYQTFTVTSAGTPLKVSFAHRARTNAGMTDSVQILIGPASGPVVSLGVYGDGPAAWGYYTTPTYIAVNTGVYQVRFKPVYWSFGNPGVGNFLDAVSVCTTAVTGIQEQSLATVTEVYPNPTSSSAVLKFNNEEGSTYTLSLYNEQGRPVRVIEEIHGSEVKLEKQDLPAGLYFYELNGQGKKMRGKIAFN